MLSTIQQNLGIKISDANEEKYAVFCLKGHPDTKYILINTQNFMTLSHVSEGEVSEKNLTFISRFKKGQTIEDSQ